MGNWTIIITGAGCHHNGIPEDADAQLKGFIEGLSEGGQQIRHASLCVQGQPVEVLIGVADDAKGVRVPDNAGEDAGLRGEPLPLHPEGASIALLESAHEKLDTLLEIAFLEAKKSTLKKIEGGGDPEEAAEKPKAKAKAEETPATPEADPEKTGASAKSKNEGSGGVTAADTSTGEVDADADSPADAVSEEAPEKSKKEEGGES